MPDVMGARGGGSHVHDRESPKMSDTLSNMKRPHNSAARDAARIIPCALLQCTKILAGGKFKVHGLTLTGG